MLKKAVQQGRRRVETGGVPSGAHGATNKEHHVVRAAESVRGRVPVEDFDEPRTKLEDFFSIREIEHSFRHAARSIQRIRRGQVGAKRG